MAIRVVLAEDSYLIRDSLERLLHRAEGVELVSVCEDFPGLERAIERQRPDVVLTDIRMPRLAKPACSPGG